MYHIHTLHRPVMDESVCYIPPPHSLSHQQLLSIFLFLFTPYVCVVVCVCVCDEERDFGSKDLNERDTTSQKKFTNMMTVCSVSFFLSVWALSVFLVVVVVISGPFKNRAPK